MKEIYLLLPSNRTGVEKLRGWMLEGDAANSVHLSLAEVAALKPTKLTAVVPAAAMAWHKLTLPRGIKAHDSRMLPALRSMLEDELLSDPEGAHITLPPDASEGAECAVMVCDREWLSSWMQAFSAASLRVSRIAPEVDPGMLAGLHEGGICSTHEHTRYVSVLRDGFLSTYAMPVPEGLIDGSGPFLATAGAFDEAVLGFGREAVQLLDVQRQLQLIAGSKWDAAQHDFALTGINRVKKTIANSALSFFTAPQWRSARLACVALSIVFSVGNIIQMVYTKGRIADAQAQVQSTAQQAFPKLTVLIDPVVQMQRELDVLQLQSGLLRKDDFLALASAAGSAISNAKTKPSALEYAGKKLVLKGIDPASATVAAGQLQALGYIGTYTNEALTVQKGD